MEIGESLVGAYFRQVRECHTVAFNIHVPGSQSELDVVGLSGTGDDASVFMAEVAVHLDGLDYGGYERTTQKVAQKVSAAREYAAMVYTNTPLHVEFWSPVVPRGLVQNLAALDLRLVVNEDFTDRVNQLAELAASKTSLTGDDAFRFLQFLTHLRGGEAALRSQLLDLWSLIRLRSAPSRHPVQ